MGDDERRLEGLLRDASRLAGHHAIGAEQAGEARRRGEPLGVALIDADRFNRSTTASAISSATRCFSALGCGVTVSVGVAVLDMTELPASSEEMFCVTELLARADAALYSAKSNGRDRVELAA